MTSTSALKLANATIKSEPKSILKKGSRSGAKKAPVFFTGNENQQPSASSTTDDTESDEFDQVHTPVSHSFELGTSREDEDEFRDLFEFRPTAQPVQQSSTLRVSNVTPSRRTPRTRRTRRHQSAVYIFHSREINSEIVKILLSSTDAFVRNFARTTHQQELSDADLFRHYRVQFVDELREFLTNANGRQTTREYANKLGASLSEPVMHNMDTLRHDLAEQEKQRLQTVQANRANDVISAAEIDRANDIDSAAETESLYDCMSNSDPNLCGSLPTTSYLDAFAKELKLREIVLLKNLRATSLNEQAHVHRNDSMTITKLHQQQKHQSQVDSMTARNKCIVNAASTTRKIVRFADSFGLDLERVRMITNNSFMDAFSQEHESDDDETGGEGSNSNDALSTATGSAPVVSKPFLVLIPLFNCNSSVRRHDPHVVKLDNYIYDYENRLIKCMVRVRNICFEKSVFARITFNNWKSFYDLSAFFIKSETVAATGTSPPFRSGGQQQTFDYFGFCIIIPERTSLLNDNSSSSITSGAKVSFKDDCIYRIEFALCLRDNRRVEHWDNNAGENYKFQCFFNK
jgi:hypothetical protein